MTFHVSVPRAELQDALKELKVVKPRPISLAMCWPWCREVMVDHSP